MANSANAIGDRTSNNITVVLLYTSFRLNIYLIIYVSLFQISYDFLQLHEKESIIDEGFQNFFEKLLQIRRKNLSAADETILQMMLDGNITTGKLYNLMSDLTC